jgi:hypothetical protein
VFLNADHMPDPSTPLIDAAEQAFTRAGRARAKTAGTQDRIEWWDSAAEAPELAGPARERFEIFGHPADGDHSEEETHPASWHTDALRAAGFREARTAWTSLTDALVLALR